MDLLRTITAERDDLAVQVADLIRERDEMTDLLADTQGKLNSTVPITNEPYLGLATTEQMFRELISRFTVGAESLFQIKVAVQLAEILGSLSAREKEYRTTDG